MAKIHVLMSTNTHTHPFINNIKSILSPQESGRVMYLFKALEGAAAAQIQLQPTAVNSH